MQLASSSKKNSARWRLWVGCRCAAWLFCLLTFRCAWAMQAPDTRDKTAHVRGQTKTVPAASSGARANGTQEANQQNQETGTTGSASAAATPPSVTLKNGVLTVKADNSDLAEILNEVASVSGMAIDGSIASSRVFGVYGPGIPPEVLTTLLAGSGYNFIMVGATQAGAPRKLLLTLQNGAATPAPAPAAAASVARSDTSQAPTATVPDEEPAGPGALTHVPPPPPEDPEQRTQQNLQRLQQMREQQQQGTPQ